MDLMNTMTLARTFVILNHVVALENHETIAYNPHSADLLVVVLLVIAGIRMVIAYEKKMVSNNEI